MKKITTIKIAANTAILTKETEEQRKERIRCNWTYTRIIPNKKKYNRKKFNKNIDF